MKLRAIIIVIFFNFSFLSAQRVVDIVANVDLVKELTKNNLARMGMSKSFKKSFMEQNENYDKINQELLQVISIHDYIYDKLYNINSAILDGKKLKYTYFYLEEIGKNSKKLLKATKEHPAIAGTLYKYYNYIYKQSLELKTEMSTVILRKNKDWLMDPYERTQLIDKIYSKVLNVNGMVMFISILIDSYKDRPFLYQIPLLGDYARIDRDLVYSIMKKWNFYYKTL